VTYERHGISPDTLAILQSRGHTFRDTNAQGVAEVIMYNEKDDILEGGVDRRAPDGGAGLVIKK
jgi:gamma-glutamyltranspeptidase